MIAADSGDCRADCPRGLIAGGIGVIGFGLLGAALELLDPPKLVFTRYQAYASMPDTERARFALDLLRAREARERRAAQAAVTIGLTYSAGFAIAAATADTSAGRGIFAVEAGLCLVQTALSLLLFALEPRPSEQILSGYPPPR